MDAFYLSFSKIRNNWLQNRSFHLYATLAGYLTWRTFIDKHFAPGWPNSNCCRFFTPHKSLIKVIFQNLKKRRLQTELNLDKTPLGFIKRNWEVKQHALKRLKSASFVCPTESYCPMLSLNQLHYWSFRSGFKKQHFLYLTRNQLPL